MPERGGAHVHPLVRGAGSRLASGASNWAIGTAQYDALDGHDGEYCGKYGTIHTLNRSIQSYLWRA